MQNRFIAMRGAEIALAPFKQHGLSEFGVIRLVAGRPTHCWLKNRLGQRVGFASEAVTVEERRELGVLTVLTDRQISDIEATAPVQRFELSKKFENALDFGILIGRQAGSAVESGIAVSTRAGGELVIVAANFPHALAFQISERDEDFDPELPLVQYEYDQRLRWS